MLPLLQIIAVPCTRLAPPPSAKACTYTIKAGDTLWDIAQAYGTDVATLKGLNPGINEAALQIGQVGSCFPWFCIEFLSWLCFLCFGHLKSFHVLMQVIKVLC